MIALMIGVGKRFSRSEIGRVVIRWTIWFFLFAGLFLGLAVSVHGNMINDDIGWAVHNGWADVHPALHAADNSWIAKGYGMSHAEWLSDVIFYGITRRWGFEGLRLFGFVAFIVLLWLTLRRSQKSGGFKGVLLAVCGYALLVALGIVDRSQVFTYVFLALYLLWWDRSMWRWLVLVPLWAALHGGYMLFFPLFVVDRWFLRRYKEWWLIPGIALLIVLTSPAHGWALVYPFVGLTTSVNHYISEWQPYTFEGIQMTAAGLWTVWVTVKSWPHWDQRRKFWFVVFALLAAHSVRNIPLLGIYLLLEMHYERKEKGSKRLVAFVWMGAVLFLYSLYPSFSFFSTVDQSAIHVLIATKEIDKPGYEPMQYADELSYLGEPIYMDGRTNDWAGLNPPFQRDLFVPFVNASYNNFPIQSLPGYSRFQFMLVRRRSLLYRELTQMTSEWQKVFVDQKAAIYERKS